MSRQENKLALSVLTTLISGIALIYTLIMYHHIIFAVMGMSLIFLICAYILTQSLIAFNIAKSKDMNNQLKDYINDISEQLEAMNGTQAQLGKATFLYTKQAAQAVATLENNYIESQEALYRNLSSLSNAQNKATKLMIKYDQSNTTKVISTIKELRNQLSDTMIQGFDQIQPNNVEVIAALEDIVDYLKSQPVGPDQTLSIQLNNVAHELQNISSNIQHFQIPVQNVTQTSPVQTNDTLVAPIQADDVQASSVGASEITETPAQPASTQLDTSVDTAMTMDGLLTNNDIAALFDEANESIQAEPITEQATLSDIVSEVAAEESSATQVSPLVPEDPNKQLSADEIAALFAAAEPTPKKEPEPVVDENKEDEPFTPTFTVVGKSDEYIAEHQNEEAKVSTIGDLGDDPNKQLSAAEIAALFAAADPAPKKEEKPVQETIAPVADDPNKQLSADEIAALFAAADPAPKKDISEEEKMMDAAIANAEPVSVTPVSDDPNKQLSADEIAALFASLG